MATIYGLLVVVGFVCGMIGLVLGGIHERLEERMERMEEEEGEE